MAEKEKVFEQKIKHKGFFKLSDLYDFLSEFLKDKGYKISEKEYVEKVGANGKDIEISWEASKKVTDYIKYQIGISWKILGLKEAELERQGIRESTNKGDLSMKFESQIIKDYEERWEAKPIWKFLRGIYDNYIARTTIEYYSSKLATETKGIVDEVKAYLQLEAK